MDSSHQQANSNSPSAFSPFQRDMRPSPLLHPSAYPSPARSDTDCIYQSPRGLGLYTNQMPIAIPSTIPHSSAIYPPSPQPTESWNGLSCERSPLLSDSHHDSWSSMYEPSVSRSPTSWSPQYAFNAAGLGGSRQSPGLLHDSAYSHGSSLASTSGLPMYSRDEPETVFAPHIKLEANPDWSIDTDSQYSVVPNQPLTVSPARLSTTTFSSNYSYGSPQMMRYDAPLDEREEFERRTSDGSSSTSLYRSSDENTTIVTGPVPRQRVRRNKTTRENARFFCEVCNEPFQRLYNKKIHLGTHDTNRERKNKCKFPQCGKKFVRKHDLDRHVDSVHVKSKKFKCSKCPRSFARKDTLRRHEEDGCKDRNQIFPEHPRRPGGHYRPSRLVSQSERDL